CAGIDVASGQETEIGDDAVDRRHDRRALEIETRNFKRSVRRVEFGLVDVDRLLPLLDLLDGDRDTAQILGALEIALGLVERDLPARDIGFRLIERILKAPLIDTEQLLALTYLFVVVNEDIADQA